MTRQRDAASEHDETIRNALKVHDGTRRVRLNRLTLKLERRTTKSRDLCLEPSLQDATFDESQFLGLRRLLAPWVSCSFICT